MAPDGCGNVQSCGTCKAPATCAGGGTQNVCGSPPCNKQTCASQGFDCGMASDTCMGTLDCGTCPTGQTCGAESANVCGMGVCTAKTCADLGYACGMWSDGCGNTIDCGSCAANEQCGGGANPQTGVCGTTCVPKTCAQQGFNCGMATDGCGNALDCTGGTTCPSGEVCGGGGPNVCGGGSSCAAGTELVYVWALNNNIYSFDPPSKTFTLVATPDCKASSPNSMAIDRNLVAWLNYASPALGTPNDYIYKFDLKTKKGCTASGIKIPAGYTQVGMGFSSDTPGGSTETLYVDGIAGGGLAKVDMTKKTIVPIGNFSNDPNLKGQSCELTGTGNALLYGYFTTSPYVRVAQLDKTNANAISDTALKGFAPPNDWAFSFWGGNFYLYAYPNASGSPNSSVIQYDPNTGALDLAYVANAGFTIIGAGVSTCAPTCTPQTCAQANATCGQASDGCGNLIMCGDVRGRAGVHRRRVHRPPARPRPAVGRASPAACRATAAATRSTAAPAPRGLSCVAGVCSAGQLLAEDLRGPWTTCAARSATGAATSSTAAPARRDRSAAGRRRASATSLPARRRPAQGSATTAARRPTAAATSSTAALAAAARPAGAAASPTSAGAGHPVACSAQGPRRGRADWPVAGQWPATSGGIRLTLTRQ